MVGPRSDQSSLMGCFHWIFKKFFGLLHFILCGLQFVLFGIPFPLSLNVGVVIVYVIGCDRILFRYRRCLDVAFY